MQIKSSLIILVIIFFSLDAKVPYEPRCHSIEDCSVLEYCCHYGIQSQWSECCFDNHNCCHNFGCSAFGCKEEADMEDTCAFLAGEWVASDEWWTCNLCEGNMKMTVTEMSGANKIFIMTRHPNSACNCETCTCSTFEHTWIGSCSNGLITMTKELSNNDEGPGRKEPCTATVSSDTLYIQCTEHSGKYDKA